ncbi:MAG: hypothetical protein CMK59_02620 [Proteobacteria bacterium]|nr:hypothetical protein [Pseudomonadota bacterium]
MLLFSTLVFAQELSYEQACQMALERNPQLKTAQIDIESAQSALLSAKGIFDPRITAEFGRSLSTNQQLFAGVGAFNTETLGPSGSVGMQAYLPYGTSLSWTYQVSRTSSRFKLEDLDTEQEFNPFDTSLRLNINQPILEGALTNYNLRQVREAEQSVDLAQLRLIEQHQNLLSDIGKAYWNLLHQGLLLSLAEESLSIATEEVRHISAQVKEGNLASVEVDRVESARLAAESGLIDAQNTHQTATESLLIQLGLPLIQDLVLTSRPQDINHRQWDEQKEIELVLQNNPSIQIAKARKEQAEIRIKDARHAKLPELGLSASYTLSGWEEDYSEAMSELLSRELPGSYVGLSLSSPIGNWADKGQYEQRIADLKKAHLEVESLEQSLIQQTRQQVRILRSSEIKIRLAQNNVSVAEKTLAADRKLRDAGRKIEKDVLDSIKNLDEAKVALVRAQADHSQALLELARIQGALKPPS